MNEIIERAAPNEQRKTTEQSLERGSKDIFSIFFFSRRRSLRAVFFYSIFFSVYVFVLIFLATHTLEPVVFH